MLILGIDPGISNTGYGILDYSSDKISFIDYGIISTSAKEKNNKHYAITLNDPTTGNISDSKFWFNTLNSDGKFICFIILVIKNFYLV